MISGARRTAGRATLGRVTLGRLTRGRLGSGRLTLGAASIVVVTIVIVAGSLAIGANPLPLATVVEVLRGGGSDEARFVVDELRIPRTVVGVLAGAALGVAGALMQAFTRNPLADPGILGVNAGAALAVALGMSLFGVPAVSGAMWFAFAGALIVTVAVYLVGAGGRGATGPIRLTLAGVALGAVLSGITTGVVLSDPETFDAMRSWNAGSLLGRGWDSIVAVAPFVIAGLVVAALVASGLNSVALGDDVARAQGANVAGIRIGVIVAVTLLAGAATALAGPISFVGLMVPHVARWMFGADQRLILLASALLAPVVVLAADVVGRVVIAPAELPVGIVAAFVGGPVLIALARRRQASAL